MKKLRFAPLLRVSTEQQEKKGESLETQRKQIEQYVKYLGGTISSWKYSGQEHATGVEQRKKLDRLLSDSGKGIFDAIIVCDTSRWSRDNLKSKEGLQIFRDNGIRFFVGTTEYDLFNPEQTFFLSLSVEIGEFAANQGAMKSVINRIERARRGIPVTGKLPTGRTFNKKTGEWGIDKEVQKKLVWAAEQFLTSKGMATIAKTLRMNRTNLQHTLLNRCGDIWDQTFNVPRFKIHEVIETKVPRILPEDVIEALRERAEQNKGIYHGQYKHKYLLGRAILCGHCQKALSGYMPKPGQRYYRHPKYENIECNHFTRIPGEKIEDEIMLSIFQMGGDITKVKMSAKNAMPPDTGKLEAQLIEHKKTLTQINIKKDRLFEYVEDGTIEKEDLKKRLGTLKDQESSLNDEIEKIQNQLKSVPSPILLDKKAKLHQRYLLGTLKGPEHIKALPFKEKRELMRSIFAGKDPEGNRLGVYLKKVGKNWEYEIKGRFIDKTETEVFAKNTNYITGGKVDKLGSDHQPRQPRPHTEH